MPVADRLLGTAEDLDGNVYICYVDESGGVEAPNTRQGSTPLMAFAGLIIWVKAATEALKPRASYTYAIQDMARHFNHFLDQNHASGLMLCDGRRPDQDAQVAHSIFMLKHKRVGDELPGLVEAAVFGRSENHVGLQVADIVVSGLLFPMAARVYCAGSTGGLHADSEFDELRRRYAARLRQRQHLYRDAAGKTRGGVVVSDKLGRQPSRRLFEWPG